MVTNRPFDVSIVDNIALIIKTRLKSVEAGQLSSFFYEHAKCHICLTGGIYYIISRSLGPEFGASVGIIFSFANAVSASMNTIGFCDSMNDLLKEQGVKIFDNGANDTRLVGAIALVLMCLICAVGMDWESKAQVGFEYYNFNCV